MGHNKCSYDLWLGKVVMLIETPQHNVKVAKRHVPKNVLIN